MSHTNTNKTKKKRNINNRIQSKKLNYNMDGGALDAKQIATIEAQEQQWIRIRWQTTIMINIQLPKGKKVKPQELIELDCDTRNFVKPRVMTEEELKEVLTG